MDSRNHISDTLCGCLISKGHRNSHKRREKWKSGSIHLNNSLILLPLLFLSALISPVSGETWDGVIVTAADYQSLQAFKHELDDPKGFLKSWNDSGYGACSGGWAGIKCAQGQVIVIQLPWKGLGGRITGKIGQLQGLRKLSLHDNHIGGSIPASLGLLPSLRGVQLFNNMLSGSIPPSLGFSPLLQNLDLTNNSLTGSIPDSLANSTKLYRVALSFNSLSGSFPISLTHSPSLTFLLISHNNLSGNIPNEIGSLSNLRILDLSSNAIHGSLPASIGALQNLSILNLSSNQIQGPIPTTLGNISTLAQLDLSLNNLSGAIPAALADLPHLGFLNVSYNNLTGSVPTLLSQKFNESSFVGNMQLCGYSALTTCPSEAPSQSVAPAPEVAKRRRRRLSTKDRILIAAAVLLVVLFLLCCILLCCLIRKRAASKSKDGGGAGAGAARTEKGIAAGGGEIESGGEAGGKLVHFDGPMAFTADDLLCATAEIMGKSTFGTVYKATLEDGSEVAVKRLREKITKNQREFETEVNIIGKIRHPNLLALRAYYLGPKGEKLLVFDYMPKGSLAAFLHARGPDTPIDWPTRMRIAKGMARGLSYLHANENIIHGNLTSSNVLLDEQTDSKIADYGLSKLMTAAANSNVIATAGALGYRAPELSKLKKANTKTDVYSLGVIILELLTGKSPGEPMNGFDLPQWVASIVKEEWTNEVFDLELMRDASVIGDELLNTLKLALHCVDPSPSARPEVQQVLQQLEEIRPETAASSADDGAAEASIPSTTSE
ncbi:PREDICTED: probable leucine-rich repeat receptor-like protein kinase IMK3 [Fragaria vesca subsp. vesca]|uniref:probable leucine-rich repeat receptor-like protein kinase IMK3 n=1 Tax=Fragaria vesca subsp. vesca TaxID=101020 RepID=UPI0002C33685|nr:PREDICTED: probable leucine-rich repeat receptor-like protein kinase IMK3 [Fragaria vesca subsp. vesca]